MANLVGQSFGRYHILEPLGEGGMATVYKAYDTQLEREVAIKFIRGEKLTDEKADTMLKRFQREARVLAKLSHPNILTILDYGQYQGQLYIVTNYFSGGSLKDRLGKPMPWQDAAKLLTPIARALEYAHSQGVLHRDIKPSNILLSTSGLPILADFGIAKLIESEETSDLSQLTRTEVGIGTPEYMAPEQGRGKTDQRSEIYSLGTVFYELVTGHKPYTADTPLAVLLMHASDPLPTPRKFVSVLPVDVEHVIFKAMAKKPEARYQNMGEFADALEKISVSRKNATPKIRLSKTQSVIAVCVLVGLIVGVGLITRIKTPQVRIASTLSTPVSTLTLLPTSTEISGFNTEQALTASELVTVNANTLWEDTGIFISEGDKIKISFVSGQWSGAHGGYYSNGMDCSGSYSDGLMPFVSGTSLIAKINNNTPFCVGVTPEYVSQSAGKLYFSYNDCGNPACFNDNTGSLIVRVIVTPSKGLTANGTIPTGSSSSGLEVALPPSGKLIFSEDFEQGLAHGFTLNSGNWKVVDDGTGNRVLEQNMGSDWAYASWGPSNFSDGIIESRFRITKSTDQNSGAGLGIRDTGSSVYPVFYSLRYNHLDLYYQGNGGLFQSLEAYSGGTSIQLQQGAWITVRVEVQGESFKLFVNGILITTASDSRSKQGSLYISTSPNTIAQFDDLKLWAIGSK